MINIVSRKGECQDRDIIDITGLDQGRCDRPRNTVHIGHELGLQTNNRLFLILAHQKPDHNHGHLRA